MIEILNLVMRRMLYPVVELQVRYNGPGTLLVMFSSPILFERSRPALRSFHLWTTLSSIYGSD